MARGLRRGPVLLRFRSLVDSIAGYVAGIVDTRQLSKVRYTLRDCYLSAVALCTLRPRPFAAAVPASLSAQIPSQQPVLHLRRLSDPLRLPVARSHRPPWLCYSALLPSRRRGSHSALPSPNWIGRLQRFKWLQHYQVFDARYLVTLDGSRYFSSELVSCERCLSTTTDGIERHHHDILQAAIVHPHTLHGVAAGVVLAEVRAARSAPPRSRVHTQQ